MDINKRTSLRATIDLLLFPLRATCLIENDYHTISSLASERFYYVTKEVKIKQRLSEVCFIEIRKKYFITQWFLNHMIIARKL